MSLQGDIRAYLAATGRPVTLDELVEQFGHLVPPGRAARFAEKTRLHSGGPPSRYKQPGDIDHVVAVGRRYAVSQAVFSLAGRGHIARIAPATYHTKETP